MIPAGFSRLVIAGRCASVTHDVDKFARNMAPTGLMGQAAGVFAAIMAREPDADWNKLPLEAVRARLEQDGLVVSLPPGAPHRSIEKGSAAIA
jgi:hypothetical protein